MADERDTRAEQQGDGQPENQRELDDPSSGAAMSGRPRAGATEGARREDEAGGTSDAGLGTGDAARAAAYHRGQPDDLTRRAARGSALEQDL